LLDTLQIDNIYVCASIDAEARGYPSFRRKKDRDISKRVGLMGISSAKGLTAWFVALVFVSSVPKWPGLVKLLDRVTLLRV
jgi:hypothetical protein